MRAASTPRVCRAGDRGTAKPAHHAVPLPIRRAPPPPHASSSSGEDGGATPDWDEEMSLFRRRVSAPNQLAALREREAQVELGTVLYAGDGLAIVRGLDNDAPVGTVLSFVGGARG